MGLRRVIIHWLTKQWAPREFPLSDFDRIIHEIRPCDVLLVEGRSRISSIIKYLTHSPWSHAALYLGRLHDIDSVSLREKIMHRYPLLDANTPLIAEGYLGEGFRIVSLYTYQFDHIRICRPKGLTHTDAQQVMTYAIESIDRSYSVRHIFDLMRFLLPWHFVPRRLGSSLFTKSSDVHSDICSSMIARCFGAVDFPILPDVKREDGRIVFYPRDVRLFTPSDFDYSPFFEIIKYATFSLSDNSASYRQLPWKRYHVEPPVNTDPAPEDATE